MFHGWRVLGVTVATQMVQAGLLIYGFGVIILPFATEFGVPRQTLMLGSTLLTVAVVPSLFAVLQRLEERRRPLPVAGHLPTLPAD